MLAARAKLTAQTITARSSSIICQPARQAGGDVVYFLSRLELGGTQRAGIQASELRDFSDMNNHASMIEGIRHNRAEFKLFKHCDPGDFDRRLSAPNPSRPKLVGQRQKTQAADIREIISLSR